MGVQLFMFTRDSGLLSLLPGQAPLYPSEQFDVSLQTPPIFMILTLEVNERVYIPGTKKVFNKRWQSLTNFGYSEGIPFHGNLTSLVMTIFHGGHVAQVRPFRVLP